MFVCTQNDNMKIQPWFDIFFSPFWMKQLVSGSHTTLLAPVFFILSSDVDLQSNLKL
jgi:hypothetical protein